MQKLTAIIRFAAASCLLGTLASAHAAPPSPEDRYIAARDAAIAKVSKLYNDKKAEETQQLVSQLHTVQAGKPMRNLPLRVAFPHFGPSIFLKAELTSENQTPVAELDFQRDRKRGER